MKGVPNLDATNIRPSLEKHHDSSSAKFSRAGRHNFNFCRDSDHLEQGLTQQKPTRLHALAAMPWMRWLDESAKFMLAALHSVGRSSLLDTCGCFPREHGHHRRPESTPQIGRLINMDLKVNRVVHAFESSGILQGVPLPWTIRKQLHNTIHSFIAPYPPPASVGQTSTK